MTASRAVHRIETLEDAAGYLEGLINLEKVRDSSGRLSLEPIRELLSRVGSPERGLSVFHIAGSKGKGSTALFAEAILRACGLHTGTFTSPHLDRWTQRFRIDGDDVEPGRLAAAVETLRPAVEALRAAGGTSVPSFFDATTAAALLLFREAQVDHVILEVGLGGRLDSTNAVDPKLSCITSIELEHTDRLGETLAAIAGEKAGILRPGVPAVCGALPAEAATVVASRARELGCRLDRLGSEIRTEVSGGGLAGTRLRLVDGPLEVDARIAAPGVHQASNAALAAAGVRRLLTDSIQVSALAEAVERGLAVATLPGRLEIIGRDPWVLVDSAHTRASARALAAVLAELPSPVHLVLSISAGKDAQAILEALTPHARVLTLTRAEPARSLAPEEVAALARVCAPEVDSRVVPNPHLAVRAAREGLGRSEAMCVAGSVYLAGIARRVLRDPASSGRVAVSRRPDPADER